MRVLEHFEACPAPCGGGTVTRSMRRVANATLYRVLAPAPGPEARARVILISKTDIKYISGRAEYFLLER